MIKAKSLSLKTRRSISGYLFISPFIIGFVFLMLMPFVLFIFMGLSEQHVGSEGGIIFNLVGFKNYYEALFVETDFIQQVLASLADLLITFPSILLYSFFIAIILNQKFKGRAISRAVFFLPVLVASGAAAMGQGDALMNTAISAISGNTDSVKDSLNLTSTLMDLLGTSLDSSLFDIIETLVEKIYTIAMSSGVQILIFLAGLQTISPSLYEASSIEGATAWENFWKITLPMISPLILVNAVYTIVDVMGNPNNQIVNKLYDMSMREYKYGLSSAMGTIYFGIIIAVLGIVIFLISKGVFYEDR